ncbi:MAG: DNA repair protein RecN [Oscillospiraceae bacterium]|nr:DNA repair protein RecN [Oscillospiraceae bacterium]
MLQCLSIENIAVIKQADVGFSVGFTVLTGETGAGKSILIDALHAVLGERTSRELIRTGAETAQVSAVFDELPPNARALMEEYGIPAAEDGSLLLTRAMTAAGKNICRANGTLVTVAALRALGAELVNIHGQHDNQGLLDSKRHLAYIDAKADNESLRAAYREAIHTLRTLHKENRALQTGEAEKARRQDYLRHQIDELEKAALRPGEQQELESRAAFFRNAQRIAEGLRTALAALRGEERDVQPAPGAAELTQRAAAAVGAITASYPQAAAAAQRLAAAAEELSDLRDTVSRLSEEAAFNEEERVQTEERLELYRTLCAKYGKTADELPALLAEARAEEASITGDTARLDELRGLIAAAAAETKALADQLTESRLRAGEEFCAAVQAELTSLNMPNAVFIVERRPCALTGSGGDEMEFLLSANRGESPRPLAKVASGGELSRICLAIRQVLAESDTVPTLIFDEIDAGVSGAAAQRIAAKLKAAAAVRQVICVTHLAQLACKADGHLFISKTETDTETLTAVTPLTHEGRVRELARIMSGAAPTPAQLAAAEEMLD